MAVNPLTPPLIPPTSAISSGPPPLPQTNGGAVTHNAYAQMDPDFIADAPVPRLIDGVLRWASPDPRETTDMLKRFNLTQDPGQTFTLNLSKFPQTQIRQLSLMGSSPLQVNGCILLTRDAHGFFILPRTNKVAVEVPGQPGTFLNLPLGLPYYINPATRILIWEDRLNPGANARNLCFKEMICLQYQPDPQSPFYVTPNQEVVYQTSTGQIEILSTSHPSYFTVNPSGCEEYEPDFEDGLPTSVDNPTYSATSGHLFTLTRDGHEISFVVNASGGIEVLPSGATLTPQLFLPPSERNQEDLLLASFHQTVEYDQNEYVHAYLVERLSDTNNPLRSSHRNSSLW